ncbi:probable glutamate receptor [Rhopilema esculentum]|uniref:probable glutamate receptor n=1 Tax=Rhopilema esculentum TaxID=499914 RepID=UPI0031D63161
MQLIKNVTKRTIFALNIHKSNVLVVDVDDKKTVKIVNMVKHLGVTGYREELYWMMTKRSTGQIGSKCNLLPHTYRYIDYVPASVSSDYIIEKIQRQNLASLNWSREGTTGLKSSIKELNTHTQSWFTVNSLTMQPEKHSHSTSKGEDLPPVVRVAISHTAAPWVIVEEVNKTHTDREACGRTGMLGEKFVNGTDTVKICAYGYVIDLLNLLKTKLLFEAVISTSRDGKFGSYDIETGDSDGIVREVLENKADIGIDLTENKGRSTALWFSNPHLIAPISIAYIQGNSFDESSIFGPFSKNLYIGIIGMIVGLVVIVFVIERVSPYSGFQIRQRSFVDMEDFGAFDSTTYVWGTLFTGEIIEKKPKSSGSRTMVLAFSFVSVVIISAYSGNLITYLVVLDERPPVSGLLDPKMIGEESTMKTGILDGIFIDGLIKTHSDVRVRNLYGRLTHCKSLDECVLKLKKRQIDLLMSGGPTLRYYASIDHSCSLRVMDLKERDRAIGIVARKNWPWRRRINTAINHIVASGNADYLHAKWLGKLPCKRTNTFFSLDIIRLEHLFFLLAGSMAVCIFLSLTLRIASKFYTEKKDDTDEEND